MLATEASLYNHYKSYKQARVINYPNQRIIKFEIESKNDDLEDWRIAIERIRNSSSLEVRGMEDCIKTYCLRYEKILQEFNQELSPERLKYFTEINAKSERIKDTFIKTYPCLFFKSQLKDGHVKMTEISYSEKYLASLGYTFDDFTSLVFREGLPVVIPLSNLGSASIARMRMERCLTTDPDGYQTPEIEGLHVMKGGFVKKVRIKICYYPCFENGVPGFVFIAAVVARKKISLNCPEVIRGGEINHEFIEAMAEREKEKAEFLAKYYKIKADQKYTNLHRTCTIKQIENEEDP